MGPFDLEKPEPQLRCSIEEKRSFLEGRITAVGGPGEDSDDHDDDEEKGAKENVDVPYG